MILHERIAFYRAFLNIYRNGVLAYSPGMTDDYFSVFTRSGTEKTRNAKYKPRESKCHAFHL